MPLMKTKALPVSDVPNCESWVSASPTTPPTYLPMSHQGSLRNLRNLIAGERPEFFPDIFKLFLSVNSNRVISNTGLCSATIPSRASAEL